jgi:hypothetical protein
MTGQPLLFAVNGNFCMQKNKLELVKGIAFRTKLFFVVEPYIIFVVFWVMTSCHPAGAYQHFGKRKMETLCST